jgi:hypothetical protein
VFNSATHSLACFSSLVWQQSFNLRFSCHKAPYACVVCISLPHTGCVCHTHTHARARAHARRRTHIYVHWRADYCNILWALSVLSTPGGSTHTGQGRGLRQGAEGGQTQMEKVKRLRTDAVIPRCAYVRVHVNPKRFPAAYSVCWKVRLRKSPCEPRFLLDWFLLHNFLVHTVFPGKSLSPPLINN